MKYFHTLPNALLCLLPMLVTAELSAQVSGCPNADFEGGNFAGWTGGTGWCCPININNTNITNGRHTIMTGPGTDANTNGAVPVVAPDGGAFSARLGNQNVGNQAERLSYTMIVDANNALFVYRYAVVFEDPSHSPSDQPRFEIRMFDQFGNDIACGLYNVYATSNIQGFVTISNPWGDDVLYKNWTAVGMDLSSYVGQQVTIEFRTGDCDQGGHYGYAYIDTYCSPLQISSDFCPGLPEALLSAPTGFASYLWSTGETTSSIVIQNPVTGQQITCTLTSVTGCAVVLTSVMTPSIVLADFTYEGTCMNDVQFISSSTVVSGPQITSWEWSFDDVVTSTSPDPFHAFDTPGLHSAQLVVSSSIGCVDTLVQVLDLLPSPQVDFSTTPACFGDETIFSDGTSIINSVLERSWDFGDMAGTSSVASPSYTYSSAGVYDVSLLVTDINGCRDSLSVPHTVHPFPVVELGGPIEVCEGVPVVLNAQNPAATWEWSTGALTQSIQASTSGEFWVLVTPASGCALSDTVDVLFNPLPIAELADTTLCIDIALVLDAGEPGATYAWSTGATTQVTTIPPVSGNYSLVTTSSQGCAITETINVVFVPLVFVDLGPDQLLCDGETVVLDAGVLPGLIYAWSTGSVSQTEPIFVTSDPFVDVNNGYCSASDTVGIVFSTLPVVAFVDTILCIEQAITLDAGNPGCQYLWSTGATQQEITVDSVSGTYGVVVTNPDGCITAEDALLTFIPSIVLDLGLDTVLCDGDIVLLDAQNPNATYLWSTGETTPTLEILTAAEMSVFVTNGYCEARDSISLVYMPYPLYNLPAVLDTCLEVVGTSVTFIAGPIGEHFQWSTGDTTRSITVTEFGLYSLRSTSPPRCTIEETVDLREFCIPRVFVPNSFTPNNDGVNDQFFPIGYNVKAIEFLVFDRWGKQIHKGDGLNEGWDGTFKGEPVQDGVYNWRFSYAENLDLDGGLSSVKIMTGHVTVLR